MMYYLLAVLLIVCSALLYAKSKQVYRLKEENKKLKEEMQHCALGIKVQYAWQKEMNKPMN